MFSSPYTTKAFKRFASSLLRPRPHRAEALSDDARLTSVCLTSVYMSRTLGLSREQRGLGRLKLTQR